MSSAIVSIDDNYDFIVHAVNASEYLYNIAYCWCSQQYGTNNIKYHEELCEENDIYMKINADEIQVLKKVKVSSWISTSYAFVFKRRFYLTAISDHVFDLPIPPPPPKTIISTVDNMAPTAIIKEEEFKNLSQSLMFELKGVLEKRKK